MSTIGVSIVTYNIPEHELRRSVETCLRSNRVSKVYVSDNSPAPCEWKWLRDDRIMYLYNGENLGFGSGHNVSLKKIVEIDEFVLILNTDVHFQPNCLENLTEYLDRNEDVGAVMPLVRYPDGNIQYLAKLLPTPIDLIFRRFMLSQAFKEKLARRYELRFTGYDHEMDVPTISGCFLLARSDAIRKAGFFDERYFLYMEDFDLCRRLADHERVIFTPLCEVVHEHAQGSYKDGRLLRFHITSAIRYFNKWGWFFDPRRKERNRRTLARERARLQTGCDASYKSPEDS